MLTEKDGERRDGEEIKERRDGRETTRRRKRGETNDTRTHASGQRKEKREEIARGRPNRGIKAHTHIHGQGEGRG